MGLGITLFFLNLGEWDLWIPDEARYVQVAREMVNTGDWVLMHINGQVYADKPPFFFWLIALSSYLWQGFNSFSARFPSALFGTLTMLLTFFLGKKLYDWRTGFFSGLILATNLEFPYLSTRANIDATLTFFTTASMVCFFYWHQFSKGGNKLAGVQHLSIYGFYVGMAVATLTKGPVGFVLPLLVSLIYLTLQKDWKGIKGMKLLKGMLLFGVIVLSWYLPALWRGGQNYFHATILKHTIDGFAEGWTHVHPFYYFFYHFPIQFLPWTLFLPGALVYSFSRGSFEKNKASLFLLTWFVVIFLFFSVSKGKRNLYLLPLYPAASLMIGKLWGDFISNHLENFRRKWISLPLYCLIGLFLIVGLVMPWVVFKKFPSYTLYSLPVALFITGGGVSFFFLYRHKKYALIFFFLVGIIASEFFFQQRFIFPLINPSKSERFNIRNYGPD